MFFTMIVILLISVAGLSIIATRDEMKTDNKIIWAWGWGMFTIFVLERFIQQ